MKKAKSSLLHRTCLLVHLFISTKYYQNMSKDIKVMEYTRLRLKDFCFKGDNNIASESCLSCTQHAYWLSSSFLLNIIILPQTVWELLPAQDFNFRGDYIIKKVRVVFLTCDMPTGPPLHSYQILPKYV